jgi:putative endonuclease
MPFPDLSTSHDPAPEFAAWVASRWQGLRKWPALRRHVLGWRVASDRLHSAALWGCPLSRVELGHAGECLAAKWLRAHGRQILYRNYRGAHRGEVDLVARHGTVLTFVEVKTRSGTAFGRPADAVTPDKQRLIQRGALDWLRQLGQPRLSMRFDIAEVWLIPRELPRVHVIENAFPLPDSSMAGR